MVSNSDLDRLTDACRQLSPAKGNYFETDFIRNLFLTVLDFRMQGRTVEKAIRHYMENRWDEIRTIGELEALLELHPDDKAGNTAIAQHLWHNNHWTRVGLLRRLTEFFRELHVTDQASLKAWATNAQYEKDFKGQIHGMGLAVFSWLVMRQGIETVKPDVHVHRFVETVLNRPISDAELVAALEDIAMRLSLRAYELDWRIWEHQRGSGIEFWALDDAHVSEEEPDTSPERLLTSLVEQLSEDVDEDDILRAIRDRFPEAVATISSRSGNKHLAERLAEL